MATPQPPAGLATQARDHDFVKPDDRLGELRLPMRRVLASVQRGARGLLEGWFPLQPVGGVLGAGANEDGGAGEIALRIEFRAYE